MNRKELNQLVSVTPKEYELLSLINSLTKKERVIVEVISVEDDVTHTFPFFDQ